MSYDQSAKTDLPIARPLLCAVLAIVVICLFIASGSATNPQRSKVFVPAAATVAVQG
ncbi:hypothetical protein [Pararhizobium gei]|uniref:hypothetical protein n=1 Tax=Pararhizobium gei TaxID=1395951 RepID=UPI0023DCD4C2|nr:hypothetical protein [Rhizobium gei]